VVELPVQAESNSIGLNGVTGDVLVAGIETWNHEDFVDMLGFEKDI
jgi:hypothetical protein